MLSFFRQRVEAFRLRLASANAGVALSLLGLLAGLLAGALIVLFRLIIEFAQASFLPQGDVENYEAMGTFARFALPFGGAIALGVFFQSIKVSSRQVSVIHVMERLQYHEGYLPFKNLLVQFAGGVIALVTGQSVGREGPSIHLGAAAASLSGQFFALPNNSIRTLVACGTAAAIAASFNTPLAGVIFAMEVVMMEYTIAGFTPVILAAVTATILSRAVFGASSVFYVPQLNLASIWELPYIVVMGVFLGALSAFFIAAIRYFARLAKDRKPLLAMSCAGALLGIIAIEIPAVLGTGYDSVSAAILGDIAITTVVLILFAKLIATSACIAVGIPGGLIGPSIVVGAMVGSAFAFTASYIPGFSAAPGLYVMLGMGAMMSAALQAPLAGLMTLVELTANPHLVLPAMLAVVSANITAREVFKQESIYTMLMRDAGLDYRNDPIAQSLRRMGVAAVMNRNIVEADAVISAERARELLVNTPRWINVRGNSDAGVLLPGSDLARFLEENEVDSIDLLAIPAQRQQAMPIHFQASMQEARAAVESTNAEALYVRRQIAPMNFRTVGVVTKRAIEQSYSVR